MVATADTSSLRFRRGPGHDCLAKLPEDIAGICVRHRDWLCTFAYRSISLDSGFAPREVVLVLRSLALIRLEPSEAPQAG